MLLRRVVLNGAALFIFLFPTEQNLPYTLTVMVPSGEQKNEGRGTLTFNNLYMEEQRK